MELKEAMKKGNQDNGKLIGESLLMVDKLNCGIILTNDCDRDGNSYMTFNIINLMRQSSTKQKEKKQK